MKKAVLITVGVLLATLMASADDLAVIRLALSNVTTSSTNDRAEATIRTSGEIYAIHLVSTTTGTCTVAIGSTTNTALTDFPITSYLTVTGFTSTAGTWYYPRATEVTAGNAAISDTSTLFPIISAPLQMTAVSANITNVNVTAKIVLKN